MMRATQLVSALLLTGAMLASGGLAHAQTGPATPPVNQLTQPPAVVTAGISEADLAAFLKTLDPNVKATQIKDGTEYTLTIQRDGWNYQLRITSFAQEIWIDSALGSPVADMNQVPSNVLGQLLAANYNVGPTHFSFAKNANGGMQLYLGRMLERGTVNADRLRGQIDLFCKQVHDTYPTWNALATGGK